MPEIMTLREIATRTGHTLDALRQRRARGTLGIEPVAEIAGTFVYAKDDAEKWVEDNRKVAADG